jgi:hypothetical protein
MLAPNDENDPVVACQATSMHRHGQSCHPSDRVIRKTHLFSLIFYFKIIFIPKWIANCRKGTSPKKSQYEFSPSWYSSVTEENSYCEFFGLVPFLHLAIQISYNFKREFTMCDKLRRVWKKHSTACFKVLINQKIMRKDKENPTKMGPMRVTNAPLEI